MEPFFPSIGALEQAQSIGRFLISQDKDYESWNDTHVPALAAALSFYPHVWVMPKPSEIVRRFQCCSGEECWPLPNRVLLILTFMLRHEGFSLESSLADPSFGMDLGPRYYQLTPETQAAYARLENETVGDFLVIPVDLGFKHAGKSPAESYARLCTEGRFGLDPFAMLVAFFTHAQTLGKKVMWLDTVGAQISVKGNGRFDDTPYIDRRHDNGGQVLHSLDWNYGFRKRSFRLAPSSCISR